MRGQHELDRRAARARGELVGGTAAELGEGVVERLARDAAVMRVLATTPQAVMLLGQVGELEVDGERAQHERLRVWLERGRALASTSAGPARRAARVARADRLDEVEQPRSLLLDEHAAEDRAEQPDVVVGAAPSCRAAIRLVSPSSRLRVEPEGREDALRVGLERLGHVAVRSSSRLGGASR